MRLPKLARFSSFINIKAKIYGLRFQIFVHAYIQVIFLNGNNNTLFVFDCCYACFSSFSKSMLPVKFIFC